MSADNVYQCRAQGCGAFTTASADRATSLGWGISWTGDGIHWCPYHLGRSGRTQRSQREPFDTPLWEESNE